MRKLIYLFSIIFLLTSCYPDEPVYYEDLDLVYTNYRESFDFESKGTYSMPDKIIKVTGELGDGETPEFVQEPYNSQILQQIDDNMAAMGWTKVEGTATADVNILPAAWSNTTIYYWNNYWCWYYPYYCGWGYPVSAAASYTTGTMLITMVNPNQDGIEPVVAWTAIAEGVFSGSYDFSRISNAIDRAYEQSPYLDIK